MLEVVYREETGYRATLINGCSNYTGLPPITYADDSEKYWLAAVTGSHTDVPRL